MTRILFVGHGRLGDAVLSTGVIEALAERHPDLRLTVAIAPAALPLFRAAPGLERLIPLEKRPYAGHWFGLWAGTAATLWDLVIDLRGAPMTRLLPARRRLTLGAGPGHKVEQLGRILGLAAPPAPHLWLDEAARAAADAVLPADRRVLALGAAVNWPPKSWPIESWAALAQTLTGPGGVLAGAGIAVFGARGDRPQLAPLLEALPPDRTIDLIGALDPLAAGAALQRAALYVGCDTGVTHLAAAAGVPTLALFGPGQPDVYRPFGPHTSIVREDPLPGEESEARPESPAPAPAMRRIGTARVAAAAEALLRGRV